MLALLLLQICYAFQSHSRSIYLCALRSPPIIFLYLRISSVENNMLNIPNVWNMSLFSSFILQVTLFHIGTVRGSSPRNANLD
jgi:hypothetical protein